VSNILKNNGIAIIGFIIIGVYNMFLKGADAALKEKIDERFKHNMQNPIILNQVLKSGPVSEFAMNASDMVYHNLEERDRKEDSISEAKLERKGIALGLRNEDVEALEIEQLKDYKEGNFLTEEEYKDRTERRNVRGPRF